MVGRFVDHDGGITNKPAVRFGSISVMPAPIQQPNGGMADSFCIDLHSRNGYSGSPVYVYRTGLHDLEERAPQNIEDAHFVIAGATLLVLLGIHFAQFPERWELEHGAFPSAKEEAARVPLIREGSYVKGLSGMTCVLPAWHIREILDLPKLRRHRDAVDDQEADRRLREGYPPEAETKAV